MKTILWIGLLCFFHHLSFGQHSEHKRLLYRLNLAQTNRLLTDDPDPLLHELLTSPAIDSFPAKSPADIERNGAGHYLLVGVEGEFLSARYHSVSNYHLDLIRDERDLAIYLIDSLGNAVPEAELRLDDRVIPYDPELKTYRLRKRTKGGLLRVRVGNEYLYRSIEPASSSPLIVRRVQRWVRTPAGRWISLPVRVPIGLVRGAISYFKSGFRNDYWKPRLPYQGLLRRRQPRWNSYHALSQPSYRHGDTLHLAAYVVRPNGKAERQSVTVEVSGPGQNKRITVYKQKLDPRRVGAVDDYLRVLHPGKLELRLPLDDSLRLDQRYSVSIYRKGSRLSTSFMLEDYELDRSKYALEARQKQYNGKEPVVLTATATDLNGNALRDGELRLVLLNRKAEEAYRSVVYVPDTLYNERIDLRPDGPTTIVLPDSIWPPADLQLRVNGYFRDGSGEQQTVQTLFERLHPGLLHELELKDGLLHVTSRENGEATERRVQLRMIGPGFQRDTLLTTPARLRLNPQVSTYALYDPVLPTDAPEKPSPVGWDHDRMDMLRQGNLVQVQGERRRDSVFFLVDNPYGLPVRLRLYEGTDLKEEFFTDSTILWTARERGGDVYFLRGNYTSGGETHELTAEAQRYKKALDLELEHPQLAQPGQTLEATIRVIDFKGKPAPGVVLTAGGPSTIFDKSVYTAPVIRYKQKLDPLIYGSFYSNKLSENPDNTTLTQRWYERLELAEAEYYRLRFPETGIHLEYVPIPDTPATSLAQVAPYVVNDGRMEPIYLVEIDRQIVYNYLNQAAYSYSFVSTPGKHQIRIRTQQHAITLDSVELRVGQKLTLVVNRSAETSAVGPELEQVGKFLTSSEQRRLSRTILSLTDLTSGNRQWIAQDSTRFFRVPYGTQYVLVAPISPNKIFQFYDQSERPDYLLFEPGFRYKIGPDRERLYHFDPIKKFNLGDSLRRRDSPPIGEFALTKAEIDFSPNPGQFKLKARPLPRQRKPPYPAALRMEFATDSTIRQIILLHEADTFLYLVTSQKFNLQLPAGRWQLYALADRNGYRREVDIRPHGTTLVEFTEAHKSPYSTGVELLNKLSQMQLLEQNAIIRRSNKFTFTPGSGKGLSGKILDAETSEPLIGANILIVYKGSAIVGAVTDIDGNFSIDLPARYDQIRISYTGYETRTIPGEEIAAGGNLSLSLDQHGMLDEVIVVGYGTSKRKAISASVATIESKNVTALSARTAGVSVEADAIQIRGSRSNATEVYIDGVRVESELSADFLNMEVPVAGGGLRNDFRDHAFFEPHLKTDKNGEATFRFTLPDDLASYRTYAVGVDGRGRVGVAGNAIRAFKPVTAQLAMPRFMVQGDEVDLVGRVANYTGEDLRVQTRFVQNERTLQNTDTLLQAGFNDRLRFVAPESDSLTLSYELQRDNYTEGEQRSIHLNRIGTEETVGVFHVLKGDTTLRFVPEPTYGPVTLYATAQALPQLRQDLHALRVYPYHCNEQTASRLTALLLEREIRQQLNEPLVNDTINLDLEIDRAINLLRKRRNEIGTWGWFNEARIDYRMTHLVLRALQRAEEQGFDTDFRDPALRQLTQDLPGLERRYQMLALEVLAYEKQQLDFAAYLDPLDTLNLNLYDRFQIIHLRQLAELPYSLDTLDKYRQTDLFGAVHWGQPARRWHDNRVQITALAYRIYAHREDEAMLRRIRRFFLGSRGGPNRLERRGGWGNTFLTAEVLSLIVPDYLRAAKGPQRPSLTINGTTYRKFPVSLQFDSDRPIELTQSGPEVYLTAHQSFFNTDPEPKRQYFDVHSELRQYTDRVDSLNVRDRAKLTLRWEVRADAEYVMVEVPIPAGCSYGPKFQSGYQWRNYGPSSEVYREYFRDRVVIFYRHMPKGSYKADIELEPRFTGRFTLNPAIVSEMYFPVFFGRNGVSLARIF